MHEENKAVVQRWLDAVGGNDEQVAANYNTMAPDMIWTLMGTTPISGTHRGLADIKTNFLDLCWNGDGREGSAPQGLDPEYGIKPLNVREVVALEDGRVMVHCFADGKGKNGVPYPNEYCWLVTVRDGQICELYEFADTALIERVMFDKKLVPAEQVSALA